MMAFREFHCKQKERPLCVVTSAARIKSQCFSCMLYAPVFMCVKQEIAVVELMLSFIFYSLCIQRNFQCEEPELCKPTQKAFPFSQFIKLDMTEMFDFTLLSYRTL